MSRSYAAHQRHAHRARPQLRVGVVTASDSRTRATDDSGALLERLLETRHHVVGRVVVRDQIVELRAAVDGLLRQGADAVVVNGGTGVAPRDVTVEAFEPWFVKELPGFGEQLRALSRSSIGSGAWLTRATAGVVQRRGRRALLFLLPGSPDACALAARRLILPELAHAVTVAQGDRPHA